MEHILEGHGHTLLHTKVLGIHKQNTKYVSAKKSWNVATTRIRTQVHEL